MDFDAMNAEIHEALSTIIAKYGSPITTKWVVLAESIEENGQRGMWMLTTPGQQRWESLGMLHYAIGKETAAEVLNFIQEEN